MENMFMDMEKKVLTVVYRATETTTYESLEVK